MFSLKEIAYLLRIKKANKNLKKLLKNYDFDFVITNLIHSFLSKCEDESNLLVEFKNKGYNIPLNTKISLDKTNELTIGFFSFIDKEWGEKVKTILSGENSEIKIERPENNQNDEAIVQPINGSRTEMIVVLPKKNNLRQVYETVHELTHVLDLEGDTDETATKFLLKETDSLCMEYLLDEYLLGMSDEELQKYGFDKKKLETDINIRRKAALIARLKNAFAYSHKKDSSTSDQNALNRLYSLGQIYASHFQLYPFEVKTKKIKELSNCIRNDDFEGANLVLGIDTKNNYSTKMLSYIGEVIYEYKELQKNGIDIIKYAEELEEVR